MLHAKNQNHQDQGASLVTVMMVVAMMMALAFTVVAIAFSHLNLSFKNSNNSKAKHLAEAVLAKSIDSILSNQNFGNEGTSEEKTVRVTFDSYLKIDAESEGMLTFDQALATSEGVPYSTNNRSESSIQGVGNKVVPGESFHLVARAKVKNSISTVEAVVVVPRFPFSVAAEGAIRSSGGLVVASVKPGVPYDLNYPIHEDDLEPGHLVSNSQSGDDAVVLSGENKIYGDLQSASGVTVEGETAIFGEIRTEADPESLPVVNISSYDPELEPGLQTVNSGAGTLEVVGFNKSYGSLTVDNGVRLNGGVLYVEGDLTVSAGGVSGKGALVSTGNITVYGDGEATSDNQAAIIADGDVILRGSTSSKAKFAGLIYTKGQLKAENLRLAGVFVAAGGDSAVEFKNTEVYQDSSKSRIEIRKETVFEIPAVSPPSMGFSGKTIPATYDPNALTGNLENYRNPDTGPGQPEYLFKVPFAGSSTGFITHQFGSGGVSYVETLGPDQFVLDGSSFGLKIYGQTISSVGQAESVAVDGMVAEFAAEGRTLTEAEKNSVRTSARMIFNSTGAAFNVSQSSANYSYNNSVADGGGSTGISTFDWSLDLSDFYNRAEHMEVLYWAEYYND